MHAYNPATDLNILLSTLIDFYYLYKHYHWNLTCQDFIQFHELFDSHASIILGSQDTIAERIRQLDIDVDSDLGTFQSQSIFDLSSKPSPKNNLQEILLFLIEQHDSTIKNMEHIIDHSSESKDFSTSDILTTYLEDHQKMQWFLRSSIR